MSQAAPSPQSDGPATGPAQRRKQTPRGRKPLILTTSWYTASLIRKELGSSLDALPVLDDSFRFQVHGGAWEPVRLPRDVADPMALVPGPPPEVAAVFHDLLADAGPPDAEGWSTFSFHGERLAAGRPRGVVSGPCVVAGRFGATYRIGEHVVNTDAQRAPASLTRAAAEADFGIGARGVPDQHRRKDQPRKGDRV